MSPFWLAVRAAAGGTVTDGTASVAGLAIVASDDGYDVDLTLVSQGDTSIADLATEELDDPLAEWTRAVVVDGRRDVALEMLLQGKVSAPGLSQLVRGGLIPFVEGLHGELESTTRRELLPEADAGLVRADLISAVVERFGKRSSRARECGVEGWAFVDQLSLRVSRSEDLRGSPLERCWILHEAPSPLVIRLVGGVRVGSAWLGAPSLLPGVELPGALAVTARLGSDSVSLERTSESRWCLPATTFDRAIELVAALEDYALHKTIQFVSAPSAEAFKSPGSTISWVYEDQARARSFRERWDADAEEIVTHSDVEPTIYLGRDIGVFAADRTSAAWEVVVSGGKRLVYPLVPPEETWPHGQVEDASARRAWRKLLAPDGRRSASRGLDLLRSRVVSKTARTERLLRVPKEAESRALDLPGTEPNRHLDDAVVAVAALANNRAAIARRWLLQLLADVVGLDAPLASQVIRAWQEAELLDELVNVRWSDRRFVAVSPRLRVFRDAHGIRAALVGLVLPTTLAEVIARATSAGAAVAPTKSLSPFVPRSVVLQATESGPIEEVATHLRIPTSMLGDDPFRVHPGRDLGPSSLAPSVGYEVDDVVRVAGECFIQRRWRSGAPALWTVESEHFTTWTHFFEAARLWAAAFNGLEVRLDDSVTFSVPGCFFPLAAARWLSAAGAIRSGPLGGSSDAYLYGAPTLELRDRFVARFSSFLEETLEQMRRLDRGVSDV
jgi:hypothetical protein